MTKEELKQKLKAGEDILDLFPYVQGQDCRIFKTIIPFSCTKDDDIVYIPDFHLNELIGPFESDEEIQAVLDCCYTVNDFIELCNGNRTLAERLFKIVDWQHPSTELDQMEQEDLDELNEESSQTSASTTAQRLLDTIETAVAMAGYEVIEGSSQSLIVLGKGNVNYRINLTEEAK